MLGVATISSGCGKQVSSEKSNVVDMLESDDSEVKDTLNRLCCTMKVNKHCNIYERRCPSQILYIILHSYTASLRN